MLSLIISKSDKKRSPVFHPQVDYMELRTEGNTTVSSEGFPILKGQASGAVGYTSEGIIVRQSTLRNITISSDFLPVFPEAIIIHEGTIERQAALGNISISPIVLPIVGKISEECELIEPIMLTLEQDDDGSYILSDDKFLIYGVGETYFAAKDDYIASLLNYYCLIEEKANEGDPFSKKILQDLQRFLRPIKS